MPRRTLTLLLALSCSSLALAGCTGAGKREAATLADAVDRFRRANDASKAAQAQAVAAVACTDPKVCDAKQVCVAAIEPTARAFALKDEVTRRLEDIEQKRVAPDAPEAQHLPDQLDEAQKLLEQGRAKMGDCEKKLADLRVDFGA
jgi:cell pole-organizing protein PopZ